MEINNNPLISLITISRNNAVGIEKTIQSVINQTYNNIEYIIIDGASTDGTVNIIEKYNKQITYWISEPDSGIYNAMNKGIKRSKGDYIVFLNSGDELYESQTMHKIVSQADNLDIVYSNIKMINKNKSYIKESPRKLTFQYFTHNAIPHPATLIKSNLFNSVGFYDESLKIVSDWKWFMIAICKMNATYKKTNILAAKFYEDGISSNEKHRAVLEKERQNVLKSDFTLYFEDYQRLNKYDLVLYKINICKRIANLYKRKFNKTYKRI